MSIENNSQLETAQAEISLQVHDCRIVSHKDHRALARLGFLPCPVPGATIYSRTTDRLVIVSEGQSCIWIAQQMRPDGTLRGAVTLKNGRTRGFKSPVSAARAAIKQFAGS